MSVLNLKGLGNKTLKVGGNVQVDNDVLEYYLRQSDKQGEKFKFFGNLKDPNNGTPISRKIVWDIAKYDKLTMFVEGARKNDKEEINRIETIVSEFMLKKETHRKSAFSLLYAEAKNYVKPSNIVDEDGTIMEDETIKKPVKTPEVKEEIAVTIDRSNVKKKIEVSAAVKTFMAENDSKNYIHALELAVGLLNDAHDDMAILEERLANVKPELTQKEIQDLVYDNIPSEYIEALEKVNAEPEDPDDDPKGGQALPVDYSVLKAELKAEIIAELKKELNVLSTPAEVVVDKTITKENKITLPTAKVEETKKEEEIIKKEEPKEKKKIILAELTIEELNTSSYKKLQAIGKKLGFGVDNVVKKDELISKIADKLNLTTKSAAIDDVERKPLNINKTVSKYNTARDNNASYTEDIDGIEEDFIAEKKVSSDDLIKDKTYTDSGRTKMQAIILSRKNREIK